MFDLSSLSIEELQQMERQLPLEIRRRREEGMAKAAKEMKALAETYGFAVDGAAIKRLIEGGKLPSGGDRGTPKYRHPHEPSLTWPGRGRKPGWVMEWFANGGTLEELQA